MIWFAPAPFIRSGAVAVEPIKFIVMKYYISFSGLEAPYPTFNTLTEARKYLNACKREDKKNAPLHFPLKDEYQNDKNCYRLTFGCGYNLYSAGYIHKIK